MNFTKARILGERCRLDGHRAIAHFFNACRVPTLRWWTLLPPSFANGDKVTHPHKAEFQFTPEATVFIVNVIHAHPASKKKRSKSSKMSCTMLLNGRKDFFGATCQKAPTAKPLSTSRQSAMRTTSRNSSLIPSSSKSSSCWTPSRQANSTLTRFPTSCSLLPNS